MHIPENGFYAHYKNPASVYEVVGCGWSTESGSGHSENPADFEQDEVVIYRPVFADSLAYKNGEKFWVRPVHMFLETVEYNGQAVPRFQRITDEATLAELAKVRDLMYT